MGIRVPRECCAFCVLSFLYEGRVGWWIWRGSGGRLGSSRWLRKVLVMGDVAGGEAFVDGCYVACFVLHLIFFAEYKWRWVFTMSILPCWLSAGRIRTQNPQSIENWNSSHLLCCRPISLLDSLGFGSQVGRCWWVGYFGLTKLLRASETMVVVAARINEDKPWES